MKPENMNIDANTALTMLSLIRDYSDDLVSQIDHEKTQCIKVDKKWYSYSVLE